MGHIPAVRRRARRRGRVGGGDHAAQTAPGSETPIIGSVPRAAADRGRGCPRPRSAGGNWRAPGPFVPPDPDSGSQDGDRRGVLAIILSWSSVASGSVVLSWSACPAAASRSDDVVRLGRCEVERDAAGVDAPRISSDSRSTLVISAWGPESGADGGTGGTDDVERRAGDSRTGGGAGLRVHRDRGPRGRPRVVCGRGRDPTFSPPGVAGPSASAVSSSRCSTSSRAAPAPFRSSG